MGPLAVRKEEDSRVAVRQMSIFSVFTILIDIIAAIYRLIALYNEYGYLKISFSNSPVGQLIRRVDIPIINVYLNVQAEVGGVIKYEGHIWF